MKSPAQTDAPAAIVFFDGDCGVCNGLVQFLLRLDRRQVLHYAPLQGETAARLRPRHPMMGDGTDSMFIVSNPDTPEEEFEHRSGAVLEILRRIGGIWRIFGILRLIPRSWRDGIYNWIARNRHRLLRQKASCQLLPPEQRRHILP